MVRRQQEGDVAGFEDRDPGAHRLVVDPQVVAEAAQVEQLSDAPGAGHQEALEGAQVADVAQAPHVALDVGLDVGRVVARRVDAAVVEDRVAPLEQALVQAGGGAGPKLPPGEGQQRQRRHAAGQGLAHLLHEQEVLRAREDELPHGAALVHQDLQVGEQGRHLLRLVDDQPPVPVPVQEAPRILFRGGTIVEALEIDVGVVREDAAHEGGLARLARSGDREDRIESGQLLEVRA